MPLIQCGAIVFLGALGIWALAQIIAYLKKEGADEERSRESYRRADEEREARPLSADEAGHKEMLDRRRRELAQMSDEERLAEKEILDQFYKKREIERLEAEMKKRDQPGNGIVR